MPRVASRLDHHGGQAILAPLVGFLVLFRGGDRWFDPPSLSLPGFTLENIYDHTV